MRVCFYQHARQKCRRVCTTRRSTLRRRQIEPSRLETLSESQLVLFWLGEGGRSVEIITADRQTAHTRRRPVLVRFDRFQIRARDARPPHGRRWRASPAAAVLTRAASCCSRRLRPAVVCPYGRSLLQVSGFPVRVQALPLGGAAQLRLRASLAPAELETGGARPAGGRPTLQRLQTRELLPTHGLLVSLLPGVHERDPADLLHVPEPNEPELRSRDPGARRRAEVGDSWVRRSPGMCAGMLASLKCKPRRVGRLPLVIS